MHPGWFFSATSGDSLTFDEIYTLLNSGLKLTDASEVSVSIPVEIVVRRLQLRTWHHGEYRLKEEQLHLLRMI